MKMLAEGNPNVMLVGPDRVFYNGLLGNTGKERQLGGFAIYTAPVGDFEIAIEDGPKRRTRIAAVSPHVRHRITAEANLIGSVVIEPETVAPGELDALARRTLDAQEAARMHARIADAKRRLDGSEDLSGFSTEDFDALLLGAPLPRRHLDTRVEGAARALRDLGADQPVAAEDCAMEAGLSTSHFLHLFTRETGLRFRSCRMWKRGRALLRHVTSPETLTNVALDLGYPDSTHFSHSIRRIYGLTPRSIFKGSRELEIVEGATAAH